MNFVKQGSICAPGAGLFSSSLQKSRSRHEKNEYKWIHSGLPGKNPSENGYCRHNSGKKLSQADGKVNCTLHTAYKFTLLNSDSISKTKAAPGGNALRYRL